jgi:uncharacterized protein (TIGR00251 family)
LAEAFNIIGPNPAPVLALSAEKTKLTVRLTPRSSKDRFGDYDGGVLKIYLTAPPIEGQANKSLLKFLAKELNVRVSDLSIERGAASRQKTVLILGLTDEELENKLKVLIKEG